MLHICLMGIMLLLQINTLDVFDKSENIKDNSISVEPQKIEPNNIQTSDTFFASFNSERTSIFNILSPELQRSLMVPIMGSPAPTFVS